MMASVGRSGCGVAADRRRGRSASVLGPLIAALEAPAIAAGLPTTKSGVGQARLRVALLGSGRGRAIGSCPTESGRRSPRTLLRDAGIAKDGDRAGRGGWRCGTPRITSISRSCLVRQDDFRRIWPRHDYARLRVAAREIERRYGLTVTAPADGTAARASSRAELEKAARRGVVPARVELRRAVRRAAIAAHDVDSFVLVLCADGYRVTVRRGPSGDALGYAVGRPGDRTATGDVVFYSGSRLAPDLSLPALRRRWQGGPLRVGPGSAWAGATRAAQRARLQLRRGGEDAAGIADGAADVLVAVGGVRGASTRWARLSSSGSGLGGSPAVAGA